jgi:galactokinase
MYASHKSLRDDYEVSSKELDLLVELAKKEEGTAGARMTGAGFGGCTVNIVKTDRVKDFAKNIRKSYKEVSGLTAEVYISNPADGARKL